MITVVVVVRAGYSTAHLFGSLHRYIITALSCRLVRLPTSTQDIR